MLHSALSINGGLFYLQFPHSTRISCLLSMVACGLMDQDSSENGKEDARVLPSYDDEHGGVIVELKEPIDPTDFALLLKTSLSQWKLQGKKGIWIKLPIKLVILAESTVKEGFVYHHAEPHYLMLVKWISETPSTIPANATHRLRIGAIVLNEKKELLVVLEKHGRFKGTGIWKIPTGMVEEGEDLLLGATREVKEETGVDSEFIDVLAFRQMHKTFFQKSDLFFLCMLKPLSFEIQIQESEIDGAQWMPIGEYAAQPFAEQHAVFKYAADICLAKLEGGYTGFTPRPTTTFLDHHPSYLYVNELLNLPISLN